MVDVKNGLLVHECRKGEVWIKERLGTCGDCSGGCWISGHWIDDGFGEGGGGGGALD